jgi:hypothetical protein
MRLIGLDSTNWGSCYLSDECQAQLDALALVAAFARRGKQSPALSVLVGQGRDDRLDVAIRPAGERGDVLQACVADLAVA